ncbi:hypothetical protein EZV62_003762 [Acer yangbiense]|uniref:Uncharacterized protein n=1 Tax=Acer yangbiense TaxID=1000413 RepID=A0A5C7IHM0_9ROSI|nr:hypothetical protein EZV62_003762 [Acer yangbiense]
METSTAALLFSGLATMIVIIVAWILMMVVEWVWLKPKKVEKWLRQQGFSGNSYRFLHGDMKDMSAMRKQATAKPISSADSHHHHNIVPRILPFNHHIITIYEYIPIRPIVFRTKTVNFSSDRYKEDVICFQAFIGETTASLLIWAMVLLCMHPSWQALARKEVFQVFGKDKPKFDHLNRLKLVTNILHETLRLYSSVPVLTRSTYKETKLGEASLPPGILVSLPILMVHYDHEYWGDDAEEFNPDRFSHGVSKASSNNEVSFFPFNYVHAPTVDSAFDQCCTFLVVQTLVLLPEKMEKAMGSNICTLMIDELVVQAFKVKATTRQGSKEFESFARVLSDMLSTLKPWVPRFQNVLSSPVESENQLGQSLPSKAASNEEEKSEFGSPEDLKEDTLVSPSPLVILIQTPRDKSALKMSPPKSCVLLEPIYESSYRFNDKVRKSTPYPVNCRGSQFSESSGSEGSEDLAFKYPELLGIRQACKSGIVKKELDASPDWSFSPPKSCVLLELLDEESSENAAVDRNLPITSSVLNTLNEKENDVQTGCHQIYTSCHPEPVRTNLALIESTPLCKEPESTFKTGQRPGENTLKKELWTRFEAASTYGIRYDASAHQKTAVKKGFLDMLEEASCDEEDSVLDGLR